MTVEITALMLSLGLVPVPLIVKARGRHELVCRGASSTLTFQRGMGMYHGKIVVRTPTRWKERLAGALRA